MRSPMGVRGLREPPGEPLRGSLDPLGEFLTAPGRHWVPMDPLVEVLGSFCGVPWGGGRASSMGVPGPREPPGGVLRRSLGSLWGFLIAPARSWVSMDALGETVGSSCGVPGGSWDPLEGWGPSNPHTNSHECPRGPEGGLL